MTNLKWFINRFKAMNIQEVMWRLKQSNLQIYEKRKYAKKIISVTDRVFNEEISCLSLDVDKLGINFMNEEYSLDGIDALFNIYPYERYKKDWHAGFQNTLKWPYKFSYDLKYKQRDEIGDARTNWELNRHFQFAMLAKNYYVTGEKKYLNEFIDLFDDWNENNAFLHGISWTSVMEVAIRINSWVYSYCFLAKSKDVPAEKLNQLRIGIINMTEYVSKHYSQFSSANNHLIVEAYSIGLSGILFNYKKWIDTSVNILSREILEQNYKDGVNKELSLHYQTFFMEAVGLLVRVMQSNDIKVPSYWLEMLNKMSEYVANCVGKYGEVIVFGDNDEGKILDLCGSEINHYQYTLELMSCILEDRYINFTDVSENILWLYDKSDIELIKKKKLYSNDNSICYPEGGVSILKSLDGKVLIGIDHAELGFGSIAAHGHADSLSFQMYVDGIPIFLDPGTYIYHVNIDDRDKFRKTFNHNTITVNDMDQSEILGAFLWGKRAQTELVTHSFSNTKDCLIAKHSGYEPVTHTREFEFDKISSIFCFQDILDGGQCQWVSTFVLNPKAEITNIDKNTITFIIEDLEINMKLNFEGGINVLIEQVPIEVSFSYGKKVFSNALKVSGYSNSKVTIKVEIVIKR